MSRIIPIGIFAEIDHLLREGIIRLLRRKYDVLVGKQSELLCWAILNRALLETYGKAEVTEYARENETFIWQQALQIHTDEQLSQAMSLLYCHTLAVMGPSDPDRTLALAERAAELHIWLSTASDIFMSPNVDRSTKLLLEYAEKLSKGEPPVC
jgi:hypothetical protein